MIYYYKDLASNGIGISYNRIPKGDIELITKEEYETILKQIEEEECEE